MIEYKMVRDGVEVTINIDDTVEIVFRLGRRFRYQIP